VAKSINFGLIYGMGAKKLAKTVLVFPFRVSLSKTELEQFKGI